MAQRETKPYPATHALFEALIHAEVVARAFAIDLERLQARLKDLPPPDDLRYWAPPDPRDDIETKVARHERRMESLDVPEHLLAPDDWERLHAEPSGRFGFDELMQVSPKRHWFKLYDTYHGDERGFRRAMREAMQAALDAAEELDDAAASPLDRKTSRIRFDLQRLGDTVPSPMIVGDTPPANSEIPNRIRATLPPISEWVDRLKSFLLPAPPMPGGDPAAVTVDSASTPSDQDQMVTLDQAAAVAGKSKRTLEKYLARGELPAADNPGSCGRASYWKWSALREPLQKIAKGRLPAKFPGGRVLPES